MIDVRVAVLLQYLQRRLAIFFPRAPPALGVKAAVAARCRQLLGSFSTSLEEDERLMQRQAEREASASLSEGTLLSVQFRMAKKLCLRSLIREATS